MSGQTPANVRVFVRARPLNTRELERGAKCLLRMDPETETTHISRPDDADKGAARSSKRAAPGEEIKSFVFDKSFWSVNPGDEHFINQDGVYKHAGKDFLDHAMDGYNCCIFAYGQTGSGKSHTMMGNHTEPGLIPRLCGDLFARIGKLTNKGRKFKIEVSYFEVYNEMVRDLLKPASKHNLRVREDPTKGPYVEDLTELTADTFDDVLRFMEMGSKTRTTAPTNMNDASSRSHAVFTLSIAQLSGSGSAITEKNSRFRLVDLAGSERVALTGAVAGGTRFREGANINKSLTTLGRVIAGLAEDAKGAVIPYRDSVLTWLLKDSLGGNSRTAMIACVSPSDYEEGLSTLRYADQAKRIQTRAVVNVVENENSRLQKEIAMLKVQLLRASSAIDESSISTSNSDLEQRVTTLEAENEHLRQMTNLQKRELDAEIRKAKIEKASLRMQLRLAIDSFRKPITLPPLMSDDGSNSSDSEDELPTPPVVELRTDLSSLRQFQQSVKKDIGSWNLRMREGAMRWLK
ncbi:kinesin-domain-containing protein [Saitoella complicata NRRL Y-17804]|nr:kinesin-domain-containing protein [Saitoella complicata NRRL Y-17804]ODQ54324.1 kinesin-domain-containing protein [Saitoella complicata NRRL Y-17804]